MLNTHQPRRVYHGANVRVEHRGDSLNGTLAVQKINRETGGWMDHAVFDKASDYAYSESSKCAAGLTYI
jgi:hypothetical protein